MIELLSRIPLPPAPLPHVALGWDPMVVCVAKHLCVNLARLVELWRSALSALGL
jgi:hypothetical protein